MAINSFEDYRLLAHAAALGDTIENVLEMFPDLRLSPESNDGGQILNDGQGLTFLGFRSLVFGFTVETECLLMWQDLTDSVKKQLVIPTEAIWVEDVSTRETKTTKIGQLYGAGVWFLGDQSIVLRLENGLATIRVALQSVTKEVHHLEASISRTNPPEGPLEIEEIGRRGVFPVVLLRARIGLGTRFYDLQGLLLTDERAYWNMIDRESNRLLAEGRSQRDICIEDDTYVSRDPPSLVSGIRKFFHLVFPQVRQIKSANKVSWLWVLRNFYHPITSPGGWLMKP